jgi:hypothetical protein
MKCCAELRRRGAVEESQKASSTHQSAANRSTRGRGGSNDRHWHPYWLDWTHARKVWLWRRTGEAADDKAEKDEDWGLLKPAEPVSLPGEIQAFRDALEELLEELKITLVVFVDDLDRCLPQTAISTLESIRLLLFLKRSAFVVAADNEFIRGAVRVHFAGTGISDEVATNYFDKLIQVPLHVPRLG